MPQSTENKKPNKQRLIFLLKYLMDHTDIDHSLTIYELIDILESEGYGKVTRKTATDDIQAIIENGFDIYIDNSETAYSYHYNGRPFEPAEIKMLLDAVDSFNFVAPKVVDSMSQKLIAQASVYEQEKLMIEHASDPKRVANRRLLYTLDVVQDAIHLKKKIQFQYEDRNGDKEPVLRHNGEYYVVSPYHTYQNDGRYYMLGFSERRQSINTFRLEFCRNTSLLEEEDAVPESADFDLQKYLKRTFKMYDGDSQMVTLEADYALMRKVVDKFGSDFEVQKISEERFRTEVEVSVSGTFFGWLLQYDGGIEVVAPEAVCQKYIQKLEKNLERTTKRLNAYYQKLQEIQKNED